MPSADKTYVAQLVAAKTGLSQPDAEKRVAEVIDLPGKRRIPPVRLPRTHCCGFSWPR